MNDLELTVRLIQIGAGMAATILILLLVLYANKENRITLIDGLKVGLIFVVISIAVLCIGAALYLNPLVTIGVLAVTGIIIGVVYITHR